MRYFEFKQTLNEYSDLEQEKEEIIAKISGLTASNPDEAELLDRIYKLLNKSQIGTNIEAAFNSTLGDEQFNPAELKKVKQEITKIIASVETDYKSLNAFIKRMEAGGVVNISSLGKPVSSFQEVFGDNSGIQAFKALASYGVGKKQKGPGEYALACLSNQIKLADGEGDIEIKGIGKVELKAAMSKSGGRIGYGGGSQKNKVDVLKQYKDIIPTVMEALAKNARGGSLGFLKFLPALNVDLPVTGGGSNPKALGPDNQKNRKLIMQSLCGMDMDNYADTVAQFISTSEDTNACESTYLKANFEWYKNRDHFDALLLMSVQGQKTMMIKSGEDLIKARPMLASLSISIIPTQAGAGREQWAQLTPK